MDQSKARCVRGDTCQARRAPCLYSVIQTLHKLASLDQINSVPKEQIPTSDGTAGCCYFYNARQYQTINAIRHGLSKKHLIYAIQMTMANDDIIHFVHYKPTFYCFY